GRAARWILPICIIEATARVLPSESGPVINASNSLGTICQESPYLSCSQPHGPCSPPSPSLSHSSSISSCDSQFTRNDTASSNVNSGPPLIAVNRWPSSEKSTVSTSPAFFLPSNMSCGYVDTFTIFDFGRDSAPIRPENTSTQNFA